MVYDFSDLTDSQVQSLTKQVYDVLLDLPDEDWVGLYNCIFADNGKYPYIYENNAKMINQVLKNKNIWGILSFVEKTRQYSVKDAWFSLRNTKLYSDDVPQRLLWDLKEASKEMAKLLVENYADDFDMAELTDVMRPYSAIEDDEEDY